MQLSFNNLEYVIGNDGIVKKMIGQKSLQPFDENVVSFFNSLSLKLRTNRQYSDVATFGFWCRKAALLKEKDKYDDINQRLGKGIVFHSTPSNVAVNFAFSFAAALLAGNASIVRLPGKPFEQVEIICHAIKDLLEGEYKELASYICFVKYPPDKEINDLFSSICNVRVVWGGDGTIAEMRQSPLKPRATEINFADRHSIAVINADEYLIDDNKGKIVQDFYNDTYFTDQNACTSPRVIFWIGNEKEEAKKDFWGRVHDIVDNEYELAPVQAVGKLRAMYYAAAHKEVVHEKSDDMLITRLKIDSLDSDLMKFKYNSGFYFEHDIVNLSDILAVCDNRCQTLTYYGLTGEQLRRFFNECNPLGIDRAVPMGKSMDFALVWDGYDLIRELSRKWTVI